MRSTRAVYRVTFVGFALAVSALGFGCSHRSGTSTAPSAAPAAKKAPSPLTRLAANTLADAYAGGGAEADVAYRGKRFTIFGDVVTTDGDAGVRRVVLGSKLRPIDAIGIDEAAAAALVVGATIEIDCMVTGAIAEIPGIDCGPHGLPRPVSPPP